MKRITVQTPGATIEIMGAMDDRAAEEIGINTPGAMDIQIQPAPPTRQRTARDLLREELAAQAERHPDVMLCNLPRLDNAADEPTPPEFYSHGAEQ